jgi:hypothetical protein
MTVAGTVSDALVRVGRTMVLRREDLTGSPPAYTDVTVYGAPKDYSPQELVGSIIQGDTRVTISNREIVAASWPAPPKKGDKLILDSKTRNIQAVEPKYLGTELIVYVLQVRG